MTLTTEVLVSILVVAAGVAGWLAIPSRRGAVRQFVVTGTFTRLDTPADTPTIKIQCLASGDIAVTRYPVDDFTLVEPRLEIEVSSNDIRIQEHLTAKSRGDCAATFLLDMVGQDWWHVRYTNPATGHLAVFTLHNRPGITATHTLTN